MSTNPTAELLQVRRRVLHHLETQQAQMGILTPAHIQLEIEQTRREIERLMHYSYVYRLQRPISAREHPPRFPGAIMLVSTELIEPGQQMLRQAAFEAIDYHRGVLRHCWLIGTTGEQGSLAAAEWLSDHCRRLGINAYVWQVRDASSVVETYQLIQLLYASEIPESQLRDGDVVADITGATKPMSLGMLLACQGRSPVQYMVRPEQGPSVPVLLELSVPDGPAAEPEGGA